jgi:hypothetical protein
MSELLGTHDQSSLQNYCTIISHLSLYLWLLKLKSIHRVVQSRLVLALLLLCGSANGRGSLGPLLLQSLLGETFLKESLLIDSCHPVREAPIHVSLFLLFVKEGETTHINDARVEMLILVLLLGLTCT